MNSQMKDALNEFICSNTSAIEQAMENGNHGKDEPVIQDLVNYLSCPTPQPCHEDNQTLPMDDKMPTRKPSFTSTNMDVTQVRQTNCCELQSTYDTSQYSSGQVCVTSSESSYSTATQMNLLISDEQRQQQFLQHPNSYEQNTSLLYPDSIQQRSCASSGFQDVHLGGSSTCDSSRDHLNGDNQSSHSIAGSENQYIHSGQSAQFQCQVNSNRHYHHTLEAQFCGTQTNVGQFLNNSEPGTGDFKDASSLTSPFIPSVNSERHYCSSQDSLGYGLMDVIQAPVGNSETGANQFKVQEKMHVDEPQVIFNQTDNSTSSSQFDAVLVGIVEAHLQSYSSEGFNEQPSLESAQASTATNSGLGECGFKQSLTDVSTSHPIANPESVSTNSAAFDMNRSSYQQSSLPNNFTNNNFQQSPAVPMPSPAESLASDYQPQSNLCQVSSVNSDSTHYISWQSGSFSMSSTPSPYQDSQYQDSPAHNNSPTSISDNFQMSGTITQTPLPGFCQEQQLQRCKSFDSSLYQQPQGSHQSSLSDHNEFQQSPVVGPDYCSDVTIAQSPDQHSMGYQTNAASPMSVSVPFSSSATDDDVNQQHPNYLTSSVHQSSRQPNDPSGFIGYRSNEGAILTTDITSINQTSSSQSVTEYEASDSSNQKQTLTDSTKASSDVAMREFSSGEHLGSFSQLDLEAVVNSFSVKDGSSAVLQNNSDRSTTLAPPDYDRYHQYSMTPSSANFIQSNTDTDSQFSFNQQNQSAVGTGSYDPSLAMSPFATSSCDQSTAHQFGSSTFNLHSAPQVVTENYPQPMQVQDSDFANKISGLGEQGTISNTETAMDVSSSLGEKSDNLSSSISFEEIHMSIVKAGNALSNELNEANVDPRVVYDSSHPLASSVETSGSFLGMHSSSTSSLFQTEIPHAGVITYETEPQTPALTQLTDTSEAVSHQGSLNNAPNNSVSAQNSSPNANADHNLISSIFNNIQASSAQSSQLLLQEQINKQPDKTVPNFLENPGTLIPCNHNNNRDNVSFMSSTNITQAQLQTQFVATMTTTSPVNCGTIVANSGINQPKLTATSDASFTPSQHHTLSSVVSQGTSMSGNPQIFCSVKTLPQSSSSSFLTQPGIGLVDNTSVLVYSLETSQAMPTLSLNSTGAPSSTMPESTSCSGAFQHLTPPQLDNKSLVLPNAISDTMKVAINVLQGSKSSMNGITSVALSAGNPTSAMLSNQPQIIVSLEDLQKLLAQQNLSHPSPSIHQQQQTHASTSSLQTLVLQKHASHTLRQSHPRLLIKGATLPGSARVMHPHQQMQQTRDRPQLYIHQTQQAEHISTGSSSPKNMDHTVIPTAQGTHQKFPNSFQLLPVTQRDKHQTQQKLLLLQQAQTIEQQSQPKIQLQLKQTQVLQQQQAVNLFLQELTKPGDQKSAPLQLLGYQQLVLARDQQQTFSEQKHYSQNEPQSQLHLQQAQNIIQLSQIKQLQKQQEKEQELEDQQQKLFHIQQHVQSVEKCERIDRSSSDSLKKDYKHLHSLLTGDTSGISSRDTTTQVKVLPTVLNLSSSLPAQSELQLSNGLSGHSSNGSSLRPLSSITQTLAAPFSFLPVNSFSTLQLTSSSLAQPSTSLATLAFAKASSGSTVSKSFDAKEIKVETVSINSQSNSLLSQNPVKSEDSEKKESDAGGDGFSNRQASLLAQMLTERKRCHTPLSVDLNSPTNSNSEAGSPLSSPTTFEDGNTQLTLIERSADLNIKSDTMLSVDDDDGDDDDNASFDLNAFHKRPSAGEFHSTRENNGSVPMKIAKPSINADTHSSINPPLSPEPTFDFGSAVSSASNFFFAFGNKEETTSEVYTFGSLGTATSTCDSQQYKDGSKHYRPSSSKPTTNAFGMRSAVPTQPVRPTSRKQKEYSLKAYFPSKVDTMELKILEQPEPQHRARYQTEGSRGAIKDASQQGFPVIKLLGYSRATKLQVFIGDECSRGKPHGFYQACRVFGKNSTTCIEQEIEGTTVIEIEMLPENDMTVKLDCIGILKLRNADVERRIGPKRARDKKRTNIRARLVLRCMVEKSDGSQHHLQVVSNPIVCTQPVGQPEISRMSLAESSVRGGESLFIIGKNFRNKGTSVLFQKLDSNDDRVVWQAEAEIEQEFFQPTHLICKIPPYQDWAIETFLVAQIVVSCAGKKSDPMNFVYKPVFPVAPSMKREIPMETDTSVSNRSLSFVSPEALHLNRMVQQTHAQSSTSSSIFQLPPGTIPSIQTVTVRSSPATTSSRLIRPAVLTGRVTSQTVMSPNRITTASSMTTASVLSASSGSSSTTTGSGQALQTFLLEEKQDGFVQKSSSQPSKTSLLPASSTNGAMVNCIVHSNSNTNTDSPLSYAISGSHPQPSLTSSSGAGHIVRVDTPSITSQIPAKPFFVVIDPSALQTSAGGDKIQQLLLQILEAQSKSW